MDRTISLIKQSHDGDEDVYKRQEHTRQFLKRLNAEGREQKILHVAGTNGKGSVCAYLQALLLSEGKTVGMFTSPHLVKMNERICVNGQAVADEVFLESFRCV